MDHLGQDSAAAKVHKKRMSEKMVPSVQITDPDMFPMFKSHWKCEVVTFRIFSHAQYHDF